MCATLPYRFQMPRQRTKKIDVITRDCEGQKRPGRLALRPNQHHGKTETQQLDGDVGFSKVFNGSISNDALPHQRYAILNSRHIRPVSAQGNILEPHFSSQHEIGDLFSGLQL